MPTTPHIIPTQSHFLRGSPSMHLAKRGLIRVLVKNRQNAFEYEVYYIARNSRLSAKNPVTTLKTRMHFSLYFISRMLHYLYLAKAKNWGTSSKDT